MSDVTVPNFDEFTRLKNGFLKQICPTCDSLKEKTEKKHKSILNKIQTLPFIKDDSARENRIKFLKEVEIPNFENLQKIYHEECEQSLTFNTNICNTEDYCNTQLINVGLCDMNLL